MLYSHPAVMLEKALYNTIMPGQYIHMFKQVFSKSSRAFYAQVPHKIRQMCFLLQYTLQVLLSGDNTYSPQCCTNTAARHETLLRLPACSQ